MSTVEVRTEVTLNSSPYLFFTRTHTHHISHDNHRYLRISVDCKKQHGRRGRTKKKE